MKNLRMLYVHFDNAINDHEILLFRGAVNAALTENHSILFHNHKDDGFRYSYPLIQYKTDNKKALIVCIEDGAEAFCDFFNASERVFHLGNKSVRFTIEDVKAVNFKLQMDETLHKYKLQNWLPFNNENHKRYQEFESIIDRVSFIERILVGNILSFFKGMNIFTNDTIECHITEIQKKDTVRYKGLKLMSFDIEFTTHLSLPPLIGLGKGASVGYGKLTLK